MLTLNPKMLPRLAELEADLVQRREAATNAWRGEIEGIDLRLTFLRGKRSQPDARSASECPPCPPGSAETAAHRDVRPGYCDLVQEGEATVADEPTTSSALPSPVARSLPLAFAAGTAIGVLGGMIGLAGAEFRLPLLIGLFGFIALQAVIVNKAMSLIVVLTALPARLTSTG